MKTFFVLLILLVFIGIVLLVLAGIILTVLSQRSASHQAFLKGKIPAALPDGPYQGSVDFSQSTWRGKKFDAAKKIGLNLLGDKEKYPFSYYQTKSLLDGKLEVIKLDYQQPGNPFWLKMITDEIVEIEPGKFLGKVFVRLIPGMPFDLGYFRLTK